MVGLSVLPRRMFPFLSFTVAGLEPNMLALFPGRGGGKVRVRELAHK